MLEQVVYIVTTVAQGGRTLRPGLRYPVSVQLPRNPSLGTANTIRTFLPGSANAENV
jgi:hypothetical protein